MWQAGASAFFILPYQHGLRAIRQIMLMASTSALMSGWV